MPGLVESYQWHDTPTVVFQFLDYGMFLKKLADLEVGTYPCSVGLYHALKTGDVVDLPSVRTF